MITSGSVERAVLGFLLAAAIAMFAVISKALPGFFETLVANFLPASAETFPGNLKKLPHSSFFITLSLKILDFVQSQVTSFLTDNLTFYQFFN